MQEDVIGVPIKRVDSQPKWIKSRGRKIKRRDILIRKNELTWGIHFTHTHTHTLSLSLSLSLFGKVLTWNLFLFLESFLKDLLIKRKDNYVMWHGCCCSVVTRSYLTLCDPVDYNLPGSSVHGILQTRTLEWAAISFSRGSSHLRDQTCVSCISCTGRQILYPWATREALCNVIAVLIITTTAILLQYTSVSN